MYCFYFSPRTFSSGRIDPKSIISVDSPRTLDANNAHDGPFLVRFASRKRLQPILPDPSSHTYRQQRVLSCQHPALGPSITRIDPSTPIALRFNVHV